MLLLMMLQCTEVLSLHVCPVQAAQFRCIRAGPSGCPITSPKMTSPLPYRVQTTLLQDTECCLMSKARVKDRHENALQFVSATFQTGSLPSTPRTFPYDAYFISVHSLCGGTRLDSYLSAKGRCHRGKGVLVWSCRTTQVIPITWAA